MRFTDREIRLLFQLFSVPSLFNWLSDELEVENAFLDTLFHTVRLTYSHQELRDMRRCAKWLTKHYQASPGSVKMIALRLDCYEYAWNEQNPPLSEDEAITARELTISGKEHLIDVTLEAIRREKDRLSAI